MDFLAPYLNGHAAPPDPGAFADTPCAELLSGAVSPESAAARLPRAVGLVANDPDSETSQITAARLLELTRRRDGLLETWTALHQRFPANPIAFRLYLRWLRRAGRAGEGRKEVESLAIDDNSSTRDLLLAAELWTELLVHLNAERCFRAAIKRNPSAVKPRVLYARQLSARGEYLVAAEVLAKIDKIRLSEAARGIVAQVSRAKAAMTAISPLAKDAACTTAAAVKSAVLLFADRRIEVRHPTALGGVVMVTGSLGAGGAEKQMVRIAGALSERARAGGPVAGVSLNGSFEIAVSNASDIAGNAFHADETEASGLAVTDLSRAVPVRPVFDDRYRILADLLPILPKPVLFGLERLLPVLKRGRPEVAYIWQDGAVLMAVLAALAAGVPRIVLSLRGMPPNLRPNIARQEFRDMYVALAQIPGVSFTANNHAAARAYCQWLGVPETRFTVIPNAIVNPAREGSKAELEMWRNLEQRTAGAGLTLGGIFRFEPNKRPRLWIEFASKLLSVDPRWRFLLVGEGRQFTECRRLAGEVGLDRRILFVGHSHSVAFWLEKMDVLSLLSEHEGLPNVLLEAQIMGVPVVSTPAGGAAEAFDPGVTGLLMNSARQPSLEDYLQKLAFMTHDARTLSRMKTAARTRAEELFAVDRVLAHTIAHFKGQATRGPDAARRLLHGPGKDRLKPAACRVGWR